MYVQVGMSVKRVLKCHEGKSQMEEGYIQESSVQVTVQ